jgi:hypothetical protein
MTVAGQSQTLTVGLNIRPVGQGKTAEEAPPFQHWT